MNLSFFDPYLVYYCPLRISRRAKKKQPEICPLLQNSFYFRKPCLFFHSHTSCVTVVVCGLVRPTRLLLIFTTTTTCLNMRVFLIYSFDYLVLLLDSTHQNADLLNKRNLLTTFMAMGYSTSGMWDWSYVMKIDGGYMPIATARDVGWVERKEAARIYKNIEHKGPLPRL